MSQLRKAARAILPRRGLRYWVSAEYRERWAWARDRAMGQVAHGCTGGLVAGGLLKASEVPKYILTDGPLVTPKIGPGLQFMEQALLA